MACAWASVVMIEVERIWLVLKHPQAQYCSMSTYLALASACIPAPNNPTIFNKGLGITPQGKLSCSVLPFAVLYKMNFSRQATAEMGWCRVVGPRGLCRPLDVKQGFPTLRDRDWTEAGLQTCGCPGLAQEARAPGIYQPPLKKTVGSMFRHSLLPTGSERSMAALSLQSSITGFSIPRSGGTLGWGPRSEPREPMQMVSNGQRHSRQFRV